MEAMKRRGKKVGRWVERYGGEVGEKLKQWSEEGRR